MTWWDSGWQKGKYFIPLQLSYLTIHIDNQHISPKRFADHYSSPYTKCRSTIWPLPPFQSRRTTRIPACRRWPHSLRTITPQHEPIRLQQRRLEIHSNPTHIESLSKTPRVREIRRNDKPRRLRIEQNQIRMTDIRRSEVRYLSCGICGTNVGGGECEILLEPKEGRGDGSTEVRSRVNCDGDVGAV